jgi:PAS domain-containing protein
MSSNTTRFEKLLGAVPDALVGMDQKGAIRFVNRPSELLFGYDRDQLIGRAHRHAGARAALADLHRAPGGLLRRPPDSLQCTRAPDMVRAEPEAVTV